MIKYSETDKCKACHGSDGLIECKEKYSGTVGGVFNFLSSVFLKQKFEVKDISVLHPHVISLGEPV